MSIVREHIKAEGEIVNVEDILANFFLKKIGMEGSRTDSETKYKKKSKHKKHKSKKYKHKSDRRSDSSERGISDYLSIGDICSSEEKDIERLKKIKKLDVKDPRKFHSFLPISLSTQNILPANEVISNNTNASEHIDIPYGPSLELLLSSPQLIKSNVESKQRDISFDRCSESSSHQLSSMSTSLYSDPNLSSELKTLKSIEIINDRKECEEGNSSNNIEMSSEELLITSKEVASISESKESDTPSIEVKDESKDIKRKISPENFRSRSRSKSSKRSRTNNRFSRSRSRKRSVSRSRSNYRSRKKRSYSREHSRSRYSSQSKARRSKSRSRSKRRKRSRSRSCRRDRRSRSWSYSKSKNARRHSRSISRRYRSRSHEKEHESHRLEREAICIDGSNTKSSNEKESKSKGSRSRSKEKYGTTKSCKIDQAKIREIAEKNVLNMIQQGTLPEGISIENFKKKELLSIKAGGKSVQELTDFCAKLSKKENDIDEDSRDNDDCSNLEGENDFIHHPFKLKEQSVIRMNIRNAVQIPVKTHAEKFAETAKLSSQFPVSSGNQHKQKELEWIPVVPEEKKNDVQSNEVKSIVPIKSGTSVGKLVAPKTADNTKTPLAFLPVSTDIPSIPLPSVPKEPIPLPPLPPLSLSTLSTKPVSSFQLLSSNVTVQTSEMSAPSTNNVIPQSVSYPALPMSSISPVTTYHSSQISSTRVNRPYFNNQTGSTSTSQFDFASVFSKKFQAEQKLHGDPNNTEALKAIQEAEAAIQGWVNSCRVPGMFYGSTHVKPLPREKLGGFKDYRVKKDALIRAAPVTEGKGMSLLKKMGWNPGEGLGKNKEGALVPLIIDIKMDKKGLVSEGESGKNNMANAVKELQGKHPVSALMELCSKRKWKPPLYTVIKDTGPPHKKQFLFKVEVDGIDYQPVMPSSNKKVAKADAAIVCLQALKLFPV